MEIKEEMTKFAEFVKEESNGEMVLLCEMNSYTRIILVTIEDRDNDVGLDLLYELGKSDENIFKSQLKRAIGIIKNSARR